MKKTYSFRIYPNKKDVDQIEPQKFLRKSEEKLAWKQIKLSRKPPTLAWGGRHVIDSFVTQ